MLSFIFVIVPVCGLFEWKGICAGSLSFVYICIAVGDPVITRGGLGSSYQEGRVGDPVIKRGGLEI
jgi:hypothetical protein